jgi:diguanylate cyclase (GGDEF)-like protein/PAS domain S-box-containing protein
VLRTYNNYDREYFQYHKNHADEGLRVNEPLRSRSNGRWSILLTRRVNHADGTFAGVVVAAIELDYFQHFYEAFDIRAEGAIALIRDDGKLLVRRPFNDANVGRDMFSRPRFKALVDAQSIGYYRATSEFDNITKWIAYERVPDSQVLVTFATAERVILAPWRASLLRDAVVGGLFCGAVAILGCLLVFQLRARGKADAKVRESEGRYRLLAENAGDVVMRLSLDGVRQYVSPAVTQILGWTPEELINARPIDLIHPDNHAELEEIFQQMRAGSSAARVINRTRRKDGSYVWIETNFRLLHDHGARSEIVTVLRDISQRKVAEEELKVANERLRELAATDALTGLANRRSFDVALERECLRAERSDQPISLVMIDIDNFKKYNDCYGHQDGDDCLRQVAQAILHAFRRPGDLAARYGGEEFAIILPETDELGAMYVAEKLRAAVAALAREHRGSEHGSVTISLGVACAESGVRRDGAALVGKADRALYSAKDSGRNKVVCASDISATIARVA